jgi:hypothetical protein
MIPAGQVGEKAMRWAKLIVAAAAPLFLTGCLWGPGKFTSDLALRKDGRFVLDYRGQIVLQLPEDKPTAPEPWSDKMVRCYADGRVETVPPIVSSDDDAESKTRACSKAELAKHKSDYEKSQAERAAEKGKESSEMAKMFGLPGADDESNRRFAANMMKYQGWKSVRYAGKGVFDVDYHFEGRVGQDFAFPIMPDTDFIIPFITIRQRTDGSVMVVAPSFTGATGPLGARAKMMGLPDKSDGPRSRAEGVFTIITDGEILTNNSEDGPVAHPAGRRVHWDVGPGSTKIPEMLVRLR